MTNHDYIKVKWVVFGYSKESKIKLYAFLIIIIIIIIILCTEGGFGLEFIIAVKSDW